LLGSRLPRTKSLAALLKEENGIKDLFPDEAVVLMVVKRRWEQRLKDEAAKSASG